MIAPETELAGLRGLLEALESRRMSYGMHPRDGSMTPATLHEIACLKDEITQLEAMIERRRNA